MIEFFPEGRVNLSMGELSQFYESFAASNSQERLALGDLIRDFTDDQLYDFCRIVLSYTENEDLLALVFKAPQVIEKMGLVCLEKHFALLHRKKHNEGISQAFFETCAANLVSSTNPLRTLNFLAMIHPILDEQLPMVVELETLQSSALDQALAANMESLTLQRWDSGEFLHSQGSLEHFELPATLEVFLRRCLVVGNEDQVNQVLYGMFTKDRLCDSYIDVYRRVMGDAAFLSACQENLSFGEKGICSVVKLAPVLSEEALHTPEFLVSAIQKTESQHVAPYFWKFKSMGFDEKKLPLLAQFMIDNMEQIIVFSTSDTSLLNFVKEFVALAHRLGEGAKALGFVFKTMSPVIMDAPDASPYEIMDVLTKERSAPPVTEKTRGYAWLSHMVERVGLNALHEVVPDAPAAFVLEILEKKKTDLSQREAIRLFPQIKGRILEDQLGL